MMPRRPLRRLAMVLPLCGAVLTPMAAVHADSAADHFEKAHSYYEKWLRAKPGTPADPALLDSALAELVKARKGRPKDPAIPQWIGYIKLQQNKYTEALASFQETIRLSPDLPEPYINSGFANAKLGNYAAAAAACQQAIPVIKAYAARHTENNRLRFQLRKVYFDLGQAYFKQNRLSDAQHAYQRAADLNTDKPKELTPQEIALFNDADRRERGKDEAPIQDSLGETLEAQAKPAEAALAYERAAALEPANPKYLRQQGLAHRAAAKAAPDSEQAKSDWKQAGQTFQKITELAPGDYKNREYYAEALEEQGLDAEALTQYAQAAKDRAAAQDAAQTPADASYHNGLALIHREQWSEAEAQFLQASKEAPNKAENFQWLGYARYKQNEYDAAIEAYQEAAKWQPDRAETYLEMGRVYEKQVKITDALNAYSKAAELDPKSARAQYDLGSVRLLRQQYPEAAAAFQSALALDPNGRQFDAAQADAGQGYALRNVAAQESGEAQAEHLREAEAAQEAAVKLNPALTKSWIEIALIYMNQAQAVDTKLQAQHLSPNDYQAQLRDEWNKTAEKLTALLQRSPDIQDIHDLDGSALAKANQGGRAIDQFNQGVSLDKKPYEFLGQLGEALETKQSFAEAEDAYRRALAAYAEKHHEESTLLLNHLGRTQIKQEKYGDAAATFAKVLLKTPYDMKAYVYRYEALKSLNQTDEAIAALEAGLKVKENAASVSEQKQAIAEMERSLAYELTRKGGANNLHRAAELYNAALSATPQSTETFIGLGEIEIQRKNYKEALSYLKQAVAIDPKNDAAYGNLKLTEQERALYINKTRSIAYNNLGAAYEGMDKLDLAAESYRKALALDPNNAKAKANRERYAAFLKLKRH